MATFDPLKNILDASDKSGYADIYIDGMLFTRCSFDCSVKIHLVLNTCEDNLSVDDLSPEREYPLTSSQTNTKVSPHDATLTSHKTVPAAIQDNALKGEHSDSNSPIVLDV